MSSLAAMVFWLSPTARISATPCSILGPLAGRWIRRRFLGGCYGLGPEVSGVSFIGYASLCLGYSVIHVVSFFRNAVRAALPRGVFCCRARARAARSRARETEAGIACRA